MLKAKIHTAVAVFNVDFYEDTPYTVGHFCGLAEQGFYDGLKIHRIIPHFILQTGCPKNNGTGNAGYFIKCEPSALQKKHDFGVLSMANCGRHTGSSQFFIVLDRRYAAHLDGNHACFGKVDRKELAFLNNLNVDDVIEKIVVYDE
ncbi:MAG: peptidylprolyl isomerase [Bernardetiaceae bacterium]|nr:peptidylprolyl isomerase [Bernardetiaceae bacterium]